MVVKFVQSVEPSIYYLLSGSQLWDEVAAPTVRSTDLTWHDSMKPRVVKYVSTHIRALITSPSDSSHTCISLIEIKGSDQVTDTLFYIGT